jgi:hypothetical protein
MRTDRKIRDRLKKAKWENAAKERALNRKKVI